jgi:hypothetical protein
MAANLKNWFAFHIKLTKGGEQNSLEVGCGNGRRFRRFSRRSNENDDSENSQQNFFFLKSDSNNITKLT